MKKKKLGELKLAIKTERLRNLSAGELKNVAGGGNNCFRSQVCNNNASAAPPDND